MNGNDERGAASQPFKKTRLSVADVSPQQVVEGQINPSKLIFVEADPCSVTEVVQPVTDFSPVVLRDFDRDVDVEDEDRHRGGFRLQNGLVSDD